MGENSGFEQLKLNRQLLDAIADLGYSEPTPIQRKAIPLVLSGHDLFGIAQTGTGKTAAYMLPLLMKIKYAQGEDPRAVVLAPTRELVMQIHKDAQDLAQHTDLRLVALYGGTGMKNQLEAVKSGIDIIIATPGRFLDIYKTGEMNTRIINTMVLDEADKMMDMGFMPQIRNILEIIPVKRQNLLFSATMPEKVESLSHEFLDFPLKAEVTPQATPVETVEQFMYHVPNLRTKVNLLQKLLESEEFSRVIVFVKTKANADNIYKYLHRKSDDEIRLIHANKGQNTRINAMDAFKSGDVRILVATDVAARGIDVSQVSHVINFDVPLIYEDYVHRIGRTGRAKNTGVAITMVNKAEKYHLKRIEKLIRQTIPSLELPSDLEITETPKEENQQMEREIDQQKRKENPDFKGAFHEKKRRPNSTKKRYSGKGRRRKK